MQQPRVCSDAITKPADTRDLSPPKLTRPQKRRRRLQVSAAQKAIAEVRSVERDVSVEISGSAGVTNNNCSRTTGSADQFDIRMQRIEDIVFDLHWNLVGQWGSIYGQPCLDPAGEDCNGTVADALLAGLLPHVSDLSTEAPEFLPVCRTLAAQKIQHAFRVYKQRSKPEHLDHCQSERALPPEDAAYSDSSDTPENEIPCNRCGQPLDETCDGKDYDGDRCDTCDKYVHGRCLNKLLNLRGQWRLCDGCLAQFEVSPGVQSIRCDFRMLPSAYWTRLHAMFQTGPLSRPSDAKEENTLDSTADVFKPLDSCLEYMVRFLEGEHPKSEKISPNVKDHVLKTVRDAMAWKLEARTADQVKQKIDQLNKKMLAIVQHL